jgi:drug/metabolite transporter (DMT)-like permease
MVTGAPGLLLLEPSCGTRRGLSPRAWSGIAYSTLLAIVVAYILWNNAVRVVGSGRTAIFNSMIPLVAMLVAWPLLGEHPRPVQIGGAVLIVAVSCSPGGLNGQPAARAQPIACLILAIDGHHNDRP